MKVVINTCFGGFSLSPRAVRRLAELQGRPCYFFTNRAPDGSYDFHKHYPTAEKDIKGLFWSAFDIPNPDDVSGEAKPDGDGFYRSYNERSEKHSLTSRPDHRADPLLIQVVEELGGDRNGAAGDCARLSIVEIPDDVQWEIDEYDGNESIHETHRTWR